MFKGLEILLIGIAVVMAVLVMLWASCALVGMAFRAIESRNKAAKSEVKAVAPASTLAPASAPAPAGGVPPHHLAAIAAAVATVLDRPHRIVSVVAPPMLGTDWANQARLQTFNKNLRQGDWGRTIPAQPRANT